MRKITNKALDAQQPAVNDNAPEYLERIMAEAKAAQARLEQQRRGLPLDGFESVGQTASKNPPLRREQGNNGQ